MSTQPTTPALMPLGDALGVSAERWDALARATHEGHWAEGLGTLADIRAALDRIEVELVSAARQRGASWAAVAAPLGMTRQAAHVRHARHVQPQ